jgi:hypothetical protein
MITESNSFAPVSRSVGVLERWGAGKPNTPLLPHSLRAYVFSGARLAQPQRVGLRRHSSPMRPPGLLRLAQPRSTLNRYLRAQ